MINSSEVQWRWLEFEKMTGRQMHEILAVRQRIFVVEQHCVYLDADSLDPQSLHLTGRDSSGRLVAYARLNKPNSRFAEASIGRVLTVPEVRGRGLAHKAVQFCLDKCLESFPGISVKISAQLYLVDFYKGFGFKEISKPYDEDGIEHVEMKLDGRLQWSS